MVLVLEVDDANAVLTCSKLLLTYPLPIATFEPKGGLCHHDNPNVICSFLWGPSALVLDRVPIAASVGTALAFPLVRTAGRGLCHPLHTGPGLAAPCRPYRENFRFVGDNRLNLINDNPLHVSQGVAG